MCGVGGGFFLFFFPGGTIFHRDVRGFEIAQHIYIYRSSDIRNELLPRALGGKKKDRPILSMINVPSEL